MIQRSSSSKMSNEIGITDKNILKRVPPLCWEHEMLTLFIAKLCSTNGALFITQYWLASRLVTVKGHFACGFSIEYISWLEAMRCLLIKVMAYLNRSSLIMVNLKICWTRRGNYFLLVEHSSQLSKYLS